MLSVDITDRRRAETEHKLLATAIEQAAEVIVVTDAQASIQYVNPAFETTTGYARNEVLGKNPRILQSGKQDEAFYRGLWDTLTNGNTWHGRFINRKKDGQHYTEDATISPVRDEAGSIVSYVAVKRDITRDLDLEAQLLQSQKMEGIGRLAGGVAHDFNNILSVILSYAGFALGVVKEGDALRDDIIEIRKAGERAAALTRQLLAFSRKQVLQPESLELNRILTNMEKMLQRIIGEDIDLVQVLAPDLGLVTADPGQIEQVIMNLAVNARDAMPEGGKLTIETANVELDLDYAAQHREVVPGPYVMIAVSDSGVGIDQQTMTRMFEPFFTTKGAGKGTGLGLSTVMGIVKQSGGSIFVYSEIGKGTTFKIYLPRELSTASAAGAKPTTMAQPSTGTETILVVEDEEPLRRIARRTLEAAGYKVLTAANGDEALATSAGRGGAIHLLLTDVVMPQMSGRVLATQLTKQRPALKVLYMSGYTDNAIVHHGVLDAGTQFIAKPFTVDSLTRKVHEVLAGGTVDPTDKGLENVKADDQLAGRAVDSAALRAVSPELMSELRQAIGTARYDEIMRILDIIEKTQPEIASVLRQMASRFDYLAMRNLLRE
jgi:two-component system, cell cycle sensor histidine kinase and response regulator CckA